MESEPNIRCCIPTYKIEEDCYNWWERHKTKCKIVQEQKFDIVFLGDSLTHFWTKEDNINHGQGHWDEVFAKKSVLNLGFGYDRIQNVLWRIKNGELANQDPKLFVINIGTNQCSVTPNYSGDNPEETAFGVSYLAKKLHHDFPEARILVMAIFPRGGRMPIVQGINEGLHKLIPQIPGVELVDIFQDFLKKDAAEPEADPQYYQADLCHLNRKGYTLWYNALEKYL